MMMTNLVNERLLSGRKSKKEKKSAPKVRFLVQDYNSVDLSVNPSRV